MNGKYDRLGWSFRHLQENKCHFLAFLAKPEISYRENYNGSKIVAVKSQVEFINLIKMSVISLHFKEKRSKKEIFCQGILYGLKLMIVQWSSRKRL